ncbi:unnamed protein product [Blepharisma stoltei]|uniref:Kinesin motor domain-containing protein n=1 Tax=Blepharisma stoltei TaxID=1481888 RepID=A0AAU9I7N1_9CILI|nr:unnamed protein product [Blepharisma stoltei]
MANFYTSRHDLQQLSLGVPIQTVIKIKPNAGYFREDLKIHGDRIGLLDVNNRIREEYECADILDGGAPSSRLYEVSSPYLKAALEGVNVAFLAFGTSGSGKTYSIEGDASDPGLINYFSQALYQALDDKKYTLNQNRSVNQIQGFSYSVKMRYIEIVDEKITDLLIQANTRSLGNVQAIRDEWEGPSVSNASWLPCASSNHLVDMFALARRNRTQAANEFGNLHEKSTGILTLEVLQVAQNPSTGESSVLASRISFIDLPGMEKLHDDPESLRLREGINLNKGLLSLAELIRNLSQGTNDYVRYDASQVSVLMGDILGGNCLSMGIFCLQNGDMIGSSLSLNYMRMVRSIMNFPVVNDNRQLGLLRIYRVEILYLINQLSLLGPGGVDSFNTQIADLEKQLIGGNLDKLRYADEKQRLAENIRELKDSYNKLVKEKGQLQEQLIKSEEERLQIGKALIELQIENSELLEKQANADFDVNSKLLHAENEILAANTKEEKALLTVSEMQDKLKKALEDKREIEIEFVALKSNFYNLSTELNEEKLKNENLSIEVINLVNANKALSGDTDYLAKLKSNLSMDQERLILENDRLKKDNRQLEEALLNARSEVEQLRGELVKYDLNAQRQHVDFDNRKVELERGYLEITRKRDQDAQNKVQDAERRVKKLGQETEMKESDITSLSQQLKASQRKVAELEDHLNEYLKHDSEMTEECHRLQLQLEEMRGNFRTKLVRAMNEGLNPGDDMMRASREELIRSYNEREVELTEKLNKELAKNAQNVKVVRGIRAYARSLKNLAEDWAPIGKQLPDILVMPPAILLEDEDKNLAQKSQQQELERLRLRNSHLEQEVKALQSQLVANTESYTKVIQGTNNPALQQKLLSEIEYLRGAPVSQSRPGSGNYDVDVLRKERNQLREENRKLNQEIRDLRVRGGGGVGVSMSGGGNEQALQGEIERLRKKLNEYEQGISNIPAGNQNPRQLQQKVSYLEEVLRKLERERSELSIRATMAEEQLKNLNEHMNSSIQNYQRKISELKKIIQQMKGGRPEESFR